MSFEYFISLPHFFVFVFWYLASLSYMVSIVNPVWYFSIETVCFIILFFSYDRCEILSAPPPLSILCYIYFKAILGLFNPDFLSVIPVFLWIISSSQPSITTKYTIFILAWVNPPQLYELHWDLWSTSSSPHWWLLAEMEVAWESLGGMGRHHCQKAVAS